MTSEEIKATPATDKSEREWLKEVALQLALLNEKPSPQPQPQPKQNPRR